MADGSLARPYARPPLLPGQENHALDAVAAGPGPTGAGSRLTHGPPRRVRGTPGGPRGERRCGGGATCRPLLRGDWKASAQPISRSVTRSSSRRRRPPSLSPNPSPSPSSSLSPSPPHPSLPRSRWRRRPMASRSPSWSIASPPFSANDLCRAQPRRRRPRASPSRPTPMGASPGRTRPSGARWPG